MPFLQNVSKVALDFRVYGTRYRIAPGDSVEVIGDLQRRAVISIARTKGGLLTDLTPDAPQVDLKVLQAQARAEAEEILAAELADLRSTMAEQQSLIRDLLEEKRAESAPPAPDPEPEPEPAKPPPKRTAPKSMEDGPPKPKRVTRRKATKKAKPKTKKAKAKK